MSTNISKEERLVLLAAMAFLHWRDHYEYPKMLGDSIDSEELAQAIDKLSGAYKFSEKS